MGRNRERIKLDRHLLLRRGNYHYNRKVPSNLVKLDPRAPFVRVSLRTNDVALARQKRDILEDADDIYWAQLTVGENGDMAREHYLAAVQRAQAKGLTYRHSRVIASTETAEEILVRFAAAREEVSVVTKKAVLGHEEAPAVTVTEAFEIYIDKIARSEVSNKSPKQWADWKKVKKRAVSNFVKINGDMAMTAITKGHAQKLHAHWLDRIAPKEGVHKKGVRPAKATSGNRDMGNMAVLYRRYFEYIGYPERAKANPFEKLFFTEHEEKSRPPFPSEWIREKFLQPGPLVKMRRQDARAIFLAMVETGARPSEICNLLPEHIVLNHAVPHIHIKAINKPGQKRQIKTKSSERQIPLVGISLAVFQKYPQGFPRYHDKETSLSATVVKALRTKGLLPTEDHTAYSLRHSFEDRMKEANLDTELRMMLMGHTIDRPNYGRGGGLAWRRDELNKMALPFDPSIV